MADRDNRDENKAQGQSSDSKGSRSRSSGMSSEQAGRLGGQAPRRHGMSREEAGHLGGTAPHKCRGFECQKEGSSSRSRSSEEE
jgi:hypothetical protein